MIPSESQSLVDKWNRKHKPGTEVFVRADSPPHYSVLDYKTKTSGYAYVADGVVMVSVEGITGGVPLEGVEPI